MEERNDEYGGSSVIVLNNVVKTFTANGTATRALDGVSLRVAPGKIFGVIGSSGAGKSTLIRCVNLLEQPTSGEVIVDGKNLLELSTKELAKARRQIGMIFQHFHLLSSRTVFENVALPLELAGERKAAISERVFQLLDLVGLREKSESYPSSLSGGQKQRVAIARTLAPNPKVLLCDEATSALDPATTRSILKLLKSIQQRLGITILLITHEMDVVKTVCDEVAVIEAGRLVEQGTVGELFSRPQTEVAKRFLDNAIHLEVPQEYQRRAHLHFDDAKTLLRLEFSGVSKDIPVLTELYRLFEVSGHIVSAQMESNGGTKFGVMLLELAGERDRQSQALSFLQDSKIKTEVLGYV